MLQGDNKQSHFEKAEICVLPREGTEEGKNKELPMSVVLTGKMLWLSVSRKWSWGNRSVCVLGAGGEVRSGLYLGQLFTFS